MEEITFNLSLNDSITDRFIRIKESLLPLVGGRLFFACSSITQ